MLAFPQRRPRHCTQGPWTPWAGQEAEERGGHGPGPLLWARKPGRGLLHGLRTPWLQCQQAPGHQGVPSCLVPGPG